MSKQLDDEKDEMRAAALGHLSMLYQAAMGQTKETPEVLARRHTALVAFVETGSLAADDSIIMMAQQIRGLLSTQPVLSAAG